MKVDVGILIDLQKNNKPYGVWVSDRKKGFQQFYVKGYEDRGNQFRLKFETVDFNNMDWGDWWDYWTTQGSMMYYLAGPFVTDTNIPLDIFGAIAVTDIKKFVEQVKKTNRYELSSFNKEA